MKLEIKSMKKLYKEYLMCGYGCGATYHVSCITSRPFECRDCKNVSEVPSEVKIKEFKDKRPYTK